MILIYVLQSGEQRQRIANRGNRNNMLKTGGKKLGVLNRGNRDNVLQTGEMEKKTAL